MNDLRDRYRGVLVASAAGDALGATLEFMSPADIRERHGVLRDITGGGWLDLRAGEVTDDTQMALCIARSIAELGEFDPADIAKRFVEWYRSNPPDIGNTTRHALALLDSGLPWDEAGMRSHVALRPRDASNGSVMRCAPVALHAWRDDARLRQESADSSRITHANPLCIESCVALNAAIAALLHDPVADIAGMATLVTDNNDVRSAIMGASESNPDDLRAGGYVLETLQAAFWAVTNHESLEDAIIAAVNLGNDADTTGAVCGALAGARWGYSAVPERWRAALEDHDELVVLADRMLALSGADN